MSKAAARKAAQRAVKMEKCEICGAENVKLNRHHLNYENYTDVIVVCTKCHGRIHSKKRRKVKCWVCGKEFYPSHSKKGNRICSPECGVVYGRICAMQRWHGGKQNRVSEESKKVLKTDQTDLDV